MLIILSLWGCGEERGRGAHKKSWCLFSRPLTSRCQRVLAAAALGGSSFHSLMVLGRSENCLDILCAALWLLELLVVASLMMTRSVTSSVSRWYLYLLGKVRICPPLRLSKVSSVLRFKTVPMLNQHIGRSISARKTPLKHKNNDQSRLR